MTARGAAPRLLYIAAMSRSGSTLLDLLLDAHPDIASVGELHVLPHDAQSAFGALPCGCGNEVDGCPVWSTVLEETRPLSARPPRLHHFRETHQWGPTIRLDQIRGRMGSRRVPAETATYLANTMAVVSAAAAEIGEHCEPTATPPLVVVDSSKDPYRLHWLMHAPDSEVVAIHLTRDPRAVVNSLSRHVRGLRRATTIVRRTAAWMVENALIADTLRNLPAERHRRVRYEALAADPNGVVAELHAWLGLESAELKTLERHGNHALAGNPMRRTEIRPVAVDQRWSDELPRLAQLAISAATRPLRRMIGDFDA